MSTHEPDMSPERRTPSSILKGCYRLEAQVGMGGMATVYRATHSGLGLPVAVKLLSPNLSQSLPLRERFLQEARIQFQLKHPNIVQVTDYIDESGLLGYVLEWVEGTDLQQWFQHRKEPLQPEELWRVMEPVLQGVQYAHAKGVVHRDLKPSNILLHLEQGTLVPKVADFGMAKLLGEGEQPLTLTQETLGTLQYMAPEQIDNSRSVDHRADIYSLGVILFELLTGQLPFSGSASYLTYAHIWEPPPSPRSLRPELPPSLEVVLLKCLAKKPEERFSEMSELLHALQMSLSSSPPEAFSSQDSYAKPANFARLASLFVVVLCLLGVWWKWDALSLYEQRWRGASTKQPPERLKHREALNLRRATKRSAKTQPPSAKTPKVLGRQPGEGLGDSDPSTPALRTRPSVPVKRRTPLRKRRAQPRKRRTQNRKRRRRRRPPRFRRRVLKRQRSAKRKKTQNRLGTLSLLLEREKPPRRKVPSRRASNGLAVKVKQVLRDACLIRSKTRALRAVYRDLADTFPGSVPALLEQLKDRDPCVRDLVAGTVIYLDKKFRAVRGHIQRGTKHSHSWVRRRSRSMLRYLQRRDRRRKGLPPRRASSSRIGRILRVLHHTPSIGKTRQYMRFLRRKGKQDPRVAKAFIKLLDDPRKMIRTYAASSFRYLGKYGVKGTKKLIQLSIQNSQNVGLLRDIVAGLGGLAPYNIQAVVGLNMHLMSPHWEVRADAAYWMRAAGAWGDTSLPVLEQLTKDSYPLVRRFARESIRKIKQAVKKEE
ncbi:MAG: serine/threonine protein kinase [Deltaproteobacteria bacterium]|nr:MAG: serine/threonine protein kinase [Deltaproteobacteria bacterium]